MGKTRVTIFLTCGALIAMALMQFNIPLALEHFEKNTVIQFIAVTSFLVAVIAVWRLNRVERRLQALQIGLDQFERRVQKKADSSTLLPPDTYLGANGFSLPDPANAIVHHEQPPLTRFDFDDPLRPTAREQQNNVVPFLRLVKKNDPSLSASEKTTDSPDVDEASFHLRLEPIVNLETRAAHAFNLVPGYIQKDGNFLTLDAARRTSGQNLSEAKTDLKVLRYGIALVQSLQQRSENLKFYLPVSGAVLSDSDLFAAFILSLKRNAKLSDNLILGLDQTCFSSLKPADQNRFFEISELGFKMALRRCQDTQQTFSLFRQFQFESLHLSYPFLERLQASNERLSGVKRIGNSGQESMTLFVGEVSSERQVIHLLDKHIKFASGRFSSEPKPPAREQEPHRPAEA